MAERCRKRNLKLSDRDVLRRRTAATWLIAIMSSKSEHWASNAYLYQGATTDSYAKKRCNRMSWPRVNKSRRWYIESEPCFLVHSPVVPETERKRDRVTKSSEPSSTVPITNIETKCKEDAHIFSSDEAFFLKSPSSQQLLADFLDQTIVQKPNAADLVERNVQRPSRIFSPVLEPKTYDATTSINTNSKARRNLSLPPWLWTFSTKSILSPTFKDFSLPNIPIPTTLELQLSLNKLKHSMTERSNMSEREIDAVIQSMRLAVRTCSSPSAVTLAGLIDFVSILVECMEFGQDPLIAGVFHYCGCIKAREQDFLSISDTRETNFINFEAKYLQPLAGSSIEQFGPTVMQIALDAGRLKGIEMMASSILKNDKAVRGVLKIQDGKNLKSLLLTANAGLDYRALGIRCAACLYRLRGLESFKKVATHSSRLFNKKHPYLMLDEISIAREAFHIYAPLAHQLGTYRLKCELESAAFQVLFRRQYIALSSLLQGGPEKYSSQSRRVVSDVKSPFFFAEYKNPSYLAKDSIDLGMKSIMDDLSSRIKRLLQEDETMMEHIAEMKVTARIKEPYSLWRKMLEIHKRSMVDFKANPKQKKPSLSVFQVPDAVALRIILKARKLNRNESDNETSDRERLLCYYAEDLCMKHLPSSNAHTRMKDYIKRPKANGYQSLHYSSKMRWHGEEYPYEVQIRSADMHRVAEYGLASHWSYKESTLRYTPEYRASSSVSDAYLRCIQKARVNKNQLHEDRFYSCEASSYDPLLAVDNYSGSRDDGYLSLIFDLVSDRRLNKDDDKVNKLKQALRIERLRVRAEKLAPYIEALSTTRMDLAREQVFVFCNHPVYGESGNDDILSGSIITLPAGALVIDAVREEERLSGLNLGSYSNKSLLSGSRRIDSESIILRNGALTSLTQPLESGDVVTVCRPTARLDGCEISAFEESCDVLSSE